VPLSSGGRKPPRSHGLSPQGAIAAGTARTQRAGLRSVRCQGPPIRPLSWSKPAKSGLGALPRTPRLHERRQPGALSWVQSGVLSGAILIIGKRRISITAGIWGTPVRHNNTEPSVHVCAALLGRCGSNFEFSKPLAASPASPNPPTAAARRVRSCTTSRAPRGLLLPPTTRHYATVDNAGSCSPTSHPELPCRARSWPAR